MNIEKLHKSAIIFDAHVDTALSVLDCKCDLSKNSRKNQVDIPKLRAGYVDALIFAAFVAPEYKEKSYDRAVSLLNAMKKQIEKNSQDLELILDGKQIEKVCNNGKIAVMLSVEGGHAIGDDISNLDKFYSLGVRVLTLTWMNNNYFADGSGDKPKWNGLNELGVKVIKRMNELGMVIDVSHASDKAFYDVLKYSTKPVIASHSGMRSIYDFHRNLTDDMLKALANNRGVVGVPFSPSFLDRDFALKSYKIRKKLEENKDNNLNKRNRKLLLNKEIKKKLKPVEVCTVVDHIEHAVKVAGIDHVGLGSDFDGITFFINGLENCSKMVNITYELVKRGYSENDIKKILGRNFLQLLKEVNK